MTLLNLYLKHKEEIFPEKVCVNLFEDVGIPHTIVAKRYKYPFTHVSIENFLPKEDFKILSDEFQALLNKGLSPAGDYSKFSRFDMYDLYSYVPKPNLDGANRFFYSESYFKALESLFNIRLSRDTFLTYHHHLPSAADNYIHSDFSSGYFVDEPLSNGVNGWFHQCAQTKPNNISRRMARAIAVIFYLNNLEWDEKLGGETAIFETKKGGAPVRKMPPINNNLTAFEITPTSYHNFMKNNSPSRNSIAQWFFLSTEDAVRRFPNFPVSEWK